MVSSLEYAVIRQQVHSHFQRIVEILLDDEKRDYTVLDVSGACDEVTILLTHYMSDETYAIFLPISWWDKTEEEVKEFRRTHGRQEFLGTHLEIEVE